MLSKTPPLILASASPRRKELLQLLGLSFSVVKPVNINETQMLSDTHRKLSHLTIRKRAQQLCLQLASAKANDVFSKSENAVVIGADTVIATELDILGKPSSPDHARAMLRDLCGKPHHVFTGVCIQNGQKSVLFSSESVVRFHPADSFQLRWIDQYVNSGQPMDKAGAYGIQDSGAILIQSIEGDYYSVMGLPISEISRKLHDFGIETTI